MTEVESNQIVAKEAVLKEPISKETISKENFRDFFFVEQAKRLNKSCSGATEMN